MVASERLNLPSTPLHQLLDNWDAAFYQGGNPAFFPADEYLKRLRLKLLSEQDKPSRWKATTDYLLSNISKVVWGVVLAVVIALVILLFKHYGIDLKPPK